jgi:hypothetical protein
MTEMMSNAVLESQQSRNCIMYRRSTQDENLKVCHDNTKFLTF